MDQYLAARIDDCIDWWRTIEEQASLPLHTYLGMDDLEYRHWVRTGELAPAIEFLDIGGVYYWPRAGTCWVCGEVAHYLDMDFQAPVCGGICIWAGWQAMRLHDTPWRAW